MFDDLAPVGDLLFLDHRRIGLHTVDGECFGEPVRDEGVGVESGEGDELPATMKAGKRGVRSRRSI